MGPVTVPIHRWLVMRNIDLLFLLVTMRQPGTTNVAAGDTLCAVHIDAHYSALYNYLDDCNKRDNNCLDVQSFSICLASE